MPEIELQSPSESQDGFSSKVEGLEEDDDKDALGRDRFSETLVDSGVSTSNEFCLALNLLVAEEEGSLKDVRFLETLVGMSRPVALISDGFAPDFDLVEYEEDVLRLDLFSEISRVLPLTSGGFSLDTDFLEEEENPLMETAFGLLLTLSSKLDRFNAEFGLLEDGFSGSSGAFFRVVTLARDCFVAERADEEGSLEPDDLRDGFMELPMAVVLTSNGFASSVVALEGKDEEDDLELDMFEEGGRDPEVDGFLGTFVRLPSAVAMTSGRFASDAKDAAPLSLSLVVTANSQTVGCSTSVEVELEEDDEDEEIDDV